MPRRTLHGSDTVRELRTLPRVIAKIHRHGLNRGWVAADIARPNPNQIVRRCHAQGCISAPYHEHRIEFVPREIDLLAASHATQPGWCDFESNGISKAPELPDQNSETDERKRTREAIAVKAG